MILKTKLISLMSAVFLIVTPFAATPTQAATSLLPKLTYADAGVYIVTDTIVTGASDPDLSKGNVKILETLNNLNAKPLKSAPANLILNKRMLVKDFTAQNKYYIDVYDTPVIRLNNLYYSIGKTQSDVLKQAVSNGIMQPLWFVHMNPSRVTKMTYSVKSNQKEQPLGQIDTQAFISALSTCTVNQEKAVKDLTPAVPTSSKALVKLYFDSGVTYTTQFAADQSQMTLWSSDMDYACVFTLQNTSPLGVELSKISCDYDSWNDTKSSIPATGKPVIYLYPEQTQAVSVKLDFKGSLYYTYPTYQNGWDVTAQPDGTLTNKADGSTHHYLFWDGTADKKVWSFDSGFVVKSDELESFFKTNLPKMGLTPHEYNDFITYWVPKLSQNEYTMITFATEEYTDIAKLNISPSPDTVLRVHMVYKAVDGPVDIPAQEIAQAPERSGFTVVEWGGTLSE